jgi:hypothetical protein
LLGVLRSKERALVMIEPPGYFRRIRIFEIDNDVFVAVKEAGLPWRHSAMGHARKMKFRGGVEALAIKAIEQGRRRSSVKAAIVEAKPYTGHRVSGMAFGSLNAYRQHKQSFKDWR